MDKRTFLKTTAIVSAGFLLKPDEILGFNSASDVVGNQVITEFTLPKLAYSYDALEPHIDKMTMEIHHSKHHQAYITKLNEALASSTNESYKKSSLETLLANISEKDVAIRNHGGGHYNHSLFWTLLTPTTKPINEKLLTLINAKFGSFDNFKDAFTKEALSRFGSGWVWLNFDNKNGLSIVSTPNQDNPLMTSIYKEFSNTTHLLCLDVWEHAYYLKYQNKRADYVKAFWNLVNWEEVGKRMS